MKRKSKREKNCVRFRKEEERKAKNIQRRQECTMEKRQHFHYVVLGKQNSYLYRNEIRILPNTIHKNKFKMDYRSKFKARNFKTLTVKHNQNPL